MWDSCEYTSGIPETPAYNYQPFTTRQVSKVQVVPFVAKYANQACLSQPTGVSSLEIMRRFLSEILGHLQTYWKSSSYKSEILGYQPSISQTFLRWFGRLYHWL